MLAVIRNPYTEIAIYGKGAKVLLECIREEFTVEVLASENDEDLIPADVNKVRHLPEKAKKIKRLPQSPKAAKHK